MRVIYGKNESRIDLTEAVTDVSWSSSRGQLAQSLELQVSNPPVLESAGFLMLFANELKESEQLFHGPIVRYERNDKTGDLNATAYELSWYLQKNETSRVKLSGDAGKELERLVKQTGISFTCPSFGFTINERLGAQSYANLYSDITQKAYDQTGKRYYVQHQRDKLTVVHEGGNSFIPLFRVEMLESSSSGESIEEVYTVVTAERYKEDKVMASVTKEDAPLIQRLGRMQKYVDAGEERNLSALASKQLAELSKVPQTRTLTVKHQDGATAKLRAGWLVKLLEKDERTITDWIVTSCTTRWKSGQYTMNLQVERR